LDTDAGGMADGRIQKYESVTMSVAGVQSAKANKPKNELGC
jgi:hypothetical protein